MTANRLFGMFCINAAMTAIVVTLFVVDFSVPFMRDWISEPPHWSEKAAITMADYAQRHGCDELTVSVIRKDSLSGRVSAMTANMFESQYRKMGWNFVFMAGAMSLITLTAGILLLRTPGAKPT